MSDILRGIVLNPDTIYGKSAYEIAVMKGFEGTEEEWIKSLKGEEGDTPYIGANGNWYIGTTDTGIKATGTIIEQSVYVGSGTMPEEYNVQVDPNGKALSFSDDFVLSESGEIKINDSISSAKIESHEKRITNLEKGLPNDLFVTDSSVAYTKNVPEGVLPYAEVSKIGGTTKKNINLIPTLYLMPGELKGVTYTVLEDGGIIFDGTCTEVFTMPLCDERFPAGTYYLKDGASHVGCSLIAHDMDNSVVLRQGEGTFTLTENTLVSIYYRIQNTFTGTVTVYPMLTKGDTALPYEPYFEGLRSVKVTEIESMGVNLFDESQITHATTGAGVVSEAYGVVQDGVLIAKMGYHNYGIIWKPFAMNLGAGTYTISADCYISTGGAPNLRVVARLYNVKTQTHTSDTVISLSAFDKWERISAQITVAEASEYMLCVQGVGNADLGSNMDVRFKNVCVAKGNIAEYSPYKKKAFQIPEAVQALDGYGEGFDSNNFNSVEWSEDGKRVFNRRVKTVELDGSEEWYIAGGTFWTHINDSKKSQGTVLSSRYTCYIIDVLYVSVASTGVSTVDEFKAALRADPLYVTYIIDTPETVDISDLLPEDNFIDVEGNGTLTFKNGYGYAVPSEITYMLKEA